DRAGSGRYPQCRARERHDPFGAAWRDRDLAARWSSLCGRARSADSRVSSSEGGRSRTPARRCHELFWVVAMYLTGFADEAARDIDAQIRATLELGWRSIESRNIDG